MPISRDTAKLGGIQPFNIQSTFTRVGVAWDKNGNSVAENTPRFSMFGVDANGLLIEEAHTNLLSGDQSLSIVHAAPVTTGTLNGTYTFSCRTGNIVLSGGASGTVTPSSPVTAAVSSATVTLTPDVEATYNQIILKGYPLSWTLGGTEQKAETMTIPSSVLNIDTSGYSNLLPSTQATSLSAGSPYTTGTLVAGVQYTFSCTTGSYELSGGATGTVTPSTPLTKTPGAATVTLTGDSTGNQMSATSSARPWIPGGSQVNTGAGTIECEIIPSTGYDSVDHFVFSCGTTLSNNKIEIYDLSNGNIYGILSDNVGVGSNVVTTQSTTPGVAIKYAFEWDVTSSKLFRAGSQLSTSQTSHKLPVALSNMLIGSRSNGSLQINCLIRNVVVSKTKRSDSEITARAGNAIGFGQIDKYTTAQGTLMYDLTFKGLVRP